MVDGDRVVEHLDLANETLERRDTIRRAYHNVAYRAGDNAGELRAGVLVLAEILHLAKLAVHKELEEVVVYNKDDIHPTLKRHVGDGENGFWSTREQDR